MDARRRHAVLDVADVIGDHAARKDRRQIHAPAVGTELHTMVDREAGNAGVDNARLRRIADVDRGDRAERQARRPVRLAVRRTKNGRASGRDRGCQYVYIWVVAGSYKK